MLNENEKKEGIDMEEETKKEQEEIQELKEEEKPEVIEETKEPTLEDKYKELETKYKELFKEKTDKDREIRHTESYKKYDLSQENINLLKKYLGDKEDIDEELSNLNKDFPHLFNKTKDTNISNSLNVKDKFKEDTSNEIATNKLGMVG
ncbi:hypothetical protein [Spiroplasma endosymbiont of Virgichneumon dumeticola]|uniref:hypothetical protein n=1 Tax=Spiroplasma endosymbiont of Virgichneumon dumeticola TaxID=3139323 RepID=UPI0035C8CC54